MAKPTSIYHGIKYDTGKTTEVNDTLAVEEMLSISINSKPFTITMRSPGDEQELVRGLLYAEGVYTEKKNPLILITTKNREGYITGMNVSAEPDIVNFEAIAERNIISVTSCGLCGRTELNIDLNGKLIHKEKIYASQVIDMFELMRKNQSTFHSSGGSHAAAIFDVHGKLLTTKEDIGRHNAVDKVIGDLLLQNKLKEAVSLIVSGRISYEIVSKTYTAGIPFLAAVSAPSSLAVDQCREAGLTLMAFCRDKKFTVYSCAENVIMD
ncbi:MAG: formate dehydrogenase accessory sulfurtransferase FdhD [Bacteroidetes bacterium]|nr:formate dehydrogenase accessory sulfurtransferase FdhD [Bacteroidota bacterium]MBP7399270.1 formate dehydrogenase accessory sulfurtransferase FdhD [Chitinophagales bacterium]MBK7108580.1 formate dehydrogenase accessory sulfurtransferase FdhD [Bacteroidota bacterium]MBK8489095.1 formate dehydrogenase accessory sulfurtransferase FdhD [Bacteroidota bacterium]MBK8680944.1 formate dehydrogenase accessory sulfurtransferase FdhD [Bacteroidota bacterium]